MIFKLYLKTWRCGGIINKCLYSPNLDLKKVDGLGYGQTNLLNNEGYQCCIGQFLKQLLPNANLLNKMHPSQIDVANDFVEKRNNYFINSELSNKLVRINDCDHISVDYKINEIRKLLSKIGHELEVVYE